MYFLWRRTEDCKKRKDERDQQTFFSLPTLVPIDESDQATNDLDRLKRALNGLYNRYDLDALIDRRTSDPVIAIDPALLRDKVVIVGTSSTEARDWHMTPLGPMTGPEVIINATRSFLDLDWPRNNESFSSKLKKKIVIALSAAAVIFLVGWLPCEWLRSASRSPWLLREVVVHGIFLLSLIVAVLVVGWINLVALLKEGGGEVDFLVPTLAVAFEGIVELCRDLIGWIEARVHSVVAGGRSWMRNLLGLDRHV